MENDGIINYEKRLIAFIDLLGFKNAVYKTGDGTREGYNIKNNIDKIMNFNDGVYTLNKLIIKKAKKVNLQTKKSRPLTKAHITFFSDSMIISTPVIEEVNKEDGYYEEFLKTIVRLSNEYVKQGFLARGGITFGKLCHTGNICYGPAMNNAYILESQDAKFPRILIDKFAEKELLAKNTAQYSEYIKSDETDGRSFLDYLKKTKDINYYGDKEGYYELLKGIKQMIGSKFRNNNDEDIEKRILEKYEWYKEYYNDTIKKVLCQEQQDEFLIK